MHFVVRAPSGERCADIDVRLGLMAGYTGRDQDAVRAHIAELAAHGVAAPDRVPAVYPVPGARVVTAPSIDVCGSRTAGEAEFVLLHADGELLIGLGSDHTDRELEEHSVLKSKQTCDKPVSQTLWRFADVAEHWDQLRLRAWVHTEAAWRSYQDGELSTMLSPGQILEMLEELVAETGETLTTSDTAVFSGTVPLIGGEFRYGTGFRATLEDPVLQRHLECEYRVRELPALDR